MQIFRSIFADLEGFVTDPSGFKIPAILVVRKSIRFCAQNRQKGSNFEAHIGLNRKSKFKHVYLCQIHYHQT
jgi:hypothetical protein